MQRSAPLVRPDIAVILAIRRTHSTAFASLDEHAREKAHLLRATSKRGTIVLFQDDPRVSAMSGVSTQRVVRFGVSPASHLRARHISSNWPERLAFEVENGGGWLSVKTQLVGEHWLPAVLGALAAASAVGIPLDSAVRSVASVPPFRGRLQPVLLPSGAVFLRDDYNASLDGADAAFQVMRQARARRRILVISDLSDFGGNRKKRLRYIGAAVPEVAELVVFVGESIDYATRRAVEAGLPPDCVFGFSTFQETAEFLRKEEDRKNGLPFAWLPLQDPLPPAADKETIGKLRWLVPAKVHHVPSGRPTTDSISPSSGSAPGSHGLSLAALGRSVGIAESSRTRNAFDAIEEPFQA
jgi:UDP-N-acetylmuramoyl-tripeptide--D-alanyl-D-alanine ligase